MNEKRLKDVTVEISQTSYEPGQEETYNDEYRPATAYLEVESILVNEKTSMLKTLNKGDKIVFRLQDQDFLVNEDDSEFYVTFNVDVHGEIKEVLNFDENQDDDVIQEAQVLLVDAVSGGQNY